MISDNEAIRLAILLAEVCGWELCEGRIGIWQD